MSEMLNIEHARNVLAPPTEVTGLLSAYTAHADATRVEEARLPGSKVLYLSELLIGHQDSDIAFFNQVVEAIPETEPDVIVLSGLVQGDFKFTDKRRRMTLVPSLRSMDAQFAAAKEVLDALESTGVPVIYNLSNDDRRIAEEYTVEMFRKMLSLTKGQDDMPYYKVDQMRQHPSWTTHLDFQIHQAFPFMLRNGRRLKTAEENNGVEEYFELFAAHQRGQLDETGVRVTDDVNLVLGGATHAIRHNLNFSNAPMYQTHMHIPTELIGQLSAAGEDTPDALVTEHNQEAVGVLAGKGWAISTPGFIQSANFLNNRGSSTDAPGDVTRRLNTTRRRIAEPGATMHEFTDDGRHLVTFFNKKLMEKADSIDRLTIAELCDFQTGSITARADLLAKYLDYIRVRSLGENATALFFGGDMIHGRNYSAFPAESQSTGLMAIDSQIAFNEELFKAALSGFSKDEAQALERVVLQIGNHEWNSGTTKWHGYSFLDYMRHTFERELLKAGVGQEKIDQTITQQEAVKTPAGEVLQAPTSIDYFGDYGVLIQHYLMERGGKGSGGNLPIYQAHNYVTGGGDNMQNIDVLLAGHWHHPQYAVFGGKLAVIGASMAGLSGYELWRGYRPAAGGTFIHLGGGKPPVVEFISDKTLHDHKITTGKLTDEVLTDQGYTTDTDYDPYRHGLMLPRKFPKSALQKAIRHMMQDASERTLRMGELR